MPSHYEVLGIPEGASAEEVRQAYRVRVKGSHPDRFGDPAQFRLITEAYDVLSDPTRRAVYDRSCRPAPVSPAAPPSPPRTPRYGRYGALLVVALVAGGVTWLVVASANRSVGDDCVVGSWRGDAFEVPFRGFLDGREISGPLRGGAGVRLRVDADGVVRTDYSEAAPLVGTDGGARIEPRYDGTTIESWRASRGRVEQSNTDSTRLAFRVTINGRPPDRRLALSVVDRDLPYTCTAETLGVGPYRYTRLATP